LSARSDAGEIHRWHPSTPAPSAQAWDSLLRRCSSCRAEIHSQFDLPPRVARALKIEICSRQRRFAKELN
jgi:hypothetical protein